MRSPRLGGFWVAQATAHRGTEPFRTYRGRSLADVAMRCEGLRGAAQRMAGSLILPWVTVPLGLPWVVRATQIEKWGAL